MKRFYTLTLAICCLCALAIAAPVTENILEENEFKHEMFESDSSEDLTESVTIQTDLSCYGGDGNQPYVSGGFNGWCGG